MSSTDSTLTAIEGGSMSATIDTPQDQSHAHDFVQQQSDQTEVGQQGLTQQLSVQQESSFPQFTRLPVELRRKIWIFALPQQRVVGAYYSKSHKDWFTPGFYAQVRSSLLYVNRESKEVHSEHYRKFTRLEISRIAFKPTSTPFASVDFDIDAVYIRQWPINSPSSELKYQQCTHQIAIIPCRKEIRHLIVPHWWPNMHQFLDPASKGELETAVRRILLIFPALQHLDLVLEGNESPNSRLRYLDELSFEDITEASLVGTFDTTGGSRERWSEELVELQSILAVVSQLDKHIEFRCIKVQKPMPDGPTGMSHSNMRGPGGPL